MSSSQQDSTQYIDILWLKTFGLHRGNALDYFYTSPFFDSSSNNQSLRTQQLGPEFLTNMTGIQYTVDEYNTNEPALFVIKKQERMSPRSVVLLDIYYILDGIIYQSPVLMDLLRSRTAKMAIHLKRAFTELQELHNPAEETPDGDRVEKHEDDDASIRETGSVISEATTRAATRKRKLRLPAFDRVLEDVASSLKN